MKSAISDVVSADNAGPVADENSQMLVCDSAGAAGSLSEGLRHETDDDVASSGSLARRPVDEKLESVWNVVEVRNEEKRCVVSGDTETTQRHHQRQHSGESTVEERRPSMDTRAELRQPSMDKELEHNGQEHILSLMMADVEATEPADIDGGAANDDYITDNRHSVVTEPVDIDGGDYITDDRHSMVTQPADIDGGAAVNRDVVLLAQSSTARSEHASYRDELMEVSGNHDTQSITDTRSVEC